MNKTAIELILNEIELSNTEYDTAENRYNDLGDFLATNSSIKNFVPKIFPQGSFRLGTAIKPLNPEEEYDLDMTCELTRGLSTTTVSQAYVKEQVGNAIDEYIQIRGIHKHKEPKHRCWRINYKGQPSFHLDIVPGIPLQNSNAQRQVMLDSGVSEINAIAWAPLSCNITDDRRPNYRQIDSDWCLSNPRGYALWFESRMKMQLDFTMVLDEKSEPLPTFRQKTVLQQCVQLLKRHRDIMFQGDISEFKPISIIITTLAARAYNGERNLNEAITNILNKMGNLVNANGIRIPNPTMPKEDFTDKWKTNAKLETMFNAWLYQAKTDFDFIINNMNNFSISSAAHDKFGVTIDENQLPKRHAYKSPQPINLDTPQPKPHRW